MIGSRSKMVKTVDPKNCMYENMDQKMAWDPVPNPSEPGDRGWA